MSNEHVFKCAGHPQLRADINSGAIFIRGWDSDEVRISADDGAKVRQRGEKVFVESSSDCNLNIYLPRSSDVYIDGTALEVDMGGVKGVGLIDLTSGSISIVGWQGDLEIDGTTSEVRLAQCQGRVEIDTSGGGVEILSSQGTYAVDTSSGDVTLVNCSGSLEADTGGGSVTVNQFKGPVHIDTGAGDVDLKEISGRNVHVDAGRGSINAIMPGTSPGLWQLSTVSGDISLHVPENISARFEFEGSELDVSDLALASCRQEEDRMTGILNEGQGNVVVFSSTGAITARKVPAAIILDANLETEQEKDEESLKILTMLEKGAITTAEAEKLLDALQGGVDIDE